MAGTAMTVDAEADAGDADVLQSPDLVSAQALRDIRAELAEVRRVLTEGLLGPSLSAGASVTELRRQFGIFLRGNQKFPDYCEVGSGVFTDIYDWHVRHGQALEMTRQDGRTALRFMFTWLVLRADQDAAFVGIPYDRG
jgi:hypothetical protein